jgi:hypothetical protein
MSSDRAPNVRLLPGIVRGGLDGPITRRGNTTGGMVAIAERLSRHFRRPVAHQSGTGNTLKNAVQALQAG